MMKLKTIFINILIIFSCSNCTTKANIYRFNSANFDKINNKIHNWQLNGKLFWYQKSDKKSATCYVNWQKIKNKSQITFYSAFNMQNIILETYHGNKNDNKNNNQIKILSKNGKKYNNNNDYELQKTINLLPLNLNNLAYWLLGVPNPSKNYILTTNGFKQDNWSIIYDNYQQKSQSLFMPTKIIIKNCNDIPDISLTTIIKIQVLNFKEL